MQIKAQVVAVGKYKPKYKTTGLLLDSINGQETWANLPGELNYRDYKDKDVMVDITQNEKGYWSGVFVGNAQGSSQGGQNKNADPNRELHIKRGNALNAVMSATTIPSDLIGSYLTSAVNWIDNGVWNLNPFPLGDEPEF